MKDFGITKNGERVCAVTLDNGCLSCEILSYGATLRSLSVPDKAGVRRDVVLGYDSLADYESRDGYLGATVGRFANRIGGARFSLDGREYVLAANEGENQLHGGPVGFSHRVWTLEKAERERAVFALTSPDGEGGYPGNLTVRVSYVLEGSSLHLVYEARSDADTLCSLTNHSYFNLSGHGSGSIEGQTLQLCAGRYTPVDAALIPTGEIAPVAGTELDFREPKHLKAGYDHNFVLTGEAKAHSAESGITMTVSTTMPALQLYTAGVLTERTGKGGTVYRRGQGFCLETQHFPDAPNRPSFPPALLRAGEPYRHETVFAFGTAENQTNV